MAKGRVGFVNEREYELVKEIGECDLYGTNCAQCKKMPGESFHTCPFVVDVYDDYESLCNCCIDCQIICVNDRCI